MQAQARAQAVEAKRAQSDAAEQKRQLERTRAAIGVAAGSAAGAAVRPIEAALRDVLRRGGKPTTKDVTKALRKRGLLDTDADKSELKATIARVARIRKEGNKSFVVLQ